MMVEGFDSAFDGGAGHEDGPASTSTSVPQDWVEARRRRRLEEAGLPRALRGLLAKVRDESLRLLLLEGVRADIDAAVAGTGRSSTNNYEDDDIVVEANRLFPTTKTFDPGEPIGLTDVDMANPDLLGEPPPAGASSPASKPTAVHYFAARELARNPVYLGRIRRLVREALRQHHVVQFPPDVDASLPDGLPAVRPSEGVLTVKSSIGLGTATFLDGEPEGWDAWAVQEIVRRSDAAFDGGLELEPVRVLVVHAGAGGFARADAARGDRLPRIEIHEVDQRVFGQTNLPHVVTRTRETPEGKFDFVVSAFPSPATPSASGQTRIYGGDSSVGVRRWLDRLEGILQTYKDILTPGGFALVLVPLGIRTTRGYADSPELTARVKEIVEGAAGMTVLGTYATEETEPVSKPFVRRSRPSRVTYVLQAGVR